MDTTNETGEFLPLPYMPWDVRPSHTPIDAEEAATALYLSGGVIEYAAERLKCEPLRLTRVINRSLRLTRLHQELVALLNDKVHQEVIRAFASEDDRRREWASSKVMNSEQFRAHPLAPRSETPSVAIAGPAKIIFRWGDGQVLASQVESSPLIEGESSDETGGGSQGSD